ncbi:Vacuolar protein sorting-associated protein 35 [Smittium mucronatum]|uniref:Vacuolar protein sorting-associated protein 35 n=1 Tax=Smittium mucronatum TaxID=133383 RepID=A0A1R0H4D6_9FUNG|nr:Vacuolar protein sorting-associated protein 35 [Smittium mucronatum]
MKKFPNPEGFPADADQKKILSEILSNVTSQASLMKRSMDDDKVMEALKHCSNILNELKTSRLSPKLYYELYFSIFDNLQLLQPYLRDLHLSGKQHLADLYELVQYAGNVVTRLYLMITVGSVYISLPSYYSLNGITSSEEIPVKEVLLDMLEMSRGVQHPVRGLFLRYYLNQLTKDYLPIGSNQGIIGNIEDSIHFLLSNFTEMNKLWVRMQHQGLTRDKGKREEERRELRTLVGSNLLRLSLLEGVSVSKYHDVILPSLLSQVVSCKDALAQEYLMEAIVQAFSDEYHLNTLGMLVTTLGKLNPKVSVKGIILALSERVSNYYLNSGDIKLPIKNIDSIATTGSPQPSKTELTASSVSDPITSSTPLSQESEKKPPVEISDSNLSLVNTDELSDNSDSIPNTKNHSTSVDEEIDLQKASNTPIVETSSDIANTTQVESNKDVLDIVNDVKSLDIKQDLQTENIPVSTDVEEKDQPNLIKNESLQNIPQNLPHLSASNTIPPSSDHSPSTNDVLIEFWSHVQKLLLLRSDLTVPDSISITNSMLKMSISCAPQLIGFSNEILDFSLSQLNSKRVSTNTDDQSVHNSVIGILLTPLKCYPSPLDILNLDGYLPLLHSQPLKSRRNLALAFLTILLQREIIISDTQSATKALKICVYASEYENSEYENSSMEELGLLSRFIHSFKSEDPKTHLKLMEAVRGAFSPRGLAAKVVFPSIVNDCISTTMNLSEDSSPLTSESESMKLVVSFLRFIRTTLEYLVELISSDNNVSMACFNLYLLVGQSIGSKSSYTGLNFLEEAALEFYVEAMSVYGSMIVSNQAQHSALTRLIGSIYSCRIFGMENHKILVDRCSLLASRQLKRPDQCRSYLNVAHLWWRSLTDYELWHLADSEDRNPFQNLNNSEECLVLLSKSIELAKSVLEPNVTILLLIEILNNFIVLFERRCPTVTPKYINQLIAEVKEHLDRNEREINENSYDSNTNPTAPSVLSPVLTIITIDKLDDQEILLNMFNRILKYLKLKQKAMSERPLISDNNETGESDFYNQEFPVDYSAISF